MSQQVITPVIPQYNQDPDADLDYLIDWSSWLKPGDTITSSTWTVPSGLQSHNEASTDTQAVIWLKGGVLGVNYEVVNHITTAQLRVTDQTFMLFIEKH